MKIYKYLAGLALISSTALLTACQDDFDDNTPKLDIPVATSTPNTTILELKQKFWESDLNYCDKIEPNDDGTRTIIHGYVVSSDRAGNVYKKLVIQDETASLAMSINANSLYNDYRVGQEIVLDVTDMYIGKYCGCLQLGWPDVYEKTGVIQTSFMGLEVFKKHAELNGLPDAAKVDTINVHRIADIPVASEELAEWQNQLIRLNNVHFEDGGTKAFTDGYQITTNRILVDADGQKITVRTSGYATFREEMLPEGDGDVVALLDFYQTSTDSDSSPWQLTIIDANGVMNFGNPTLDPGDIDNPYTVEQVIQLEDAGKTTTAWMTGYIVGAVAPGVTTVTSNDDIEWSSEVVLDNTLVIGPTADCTNWNECVVISLPQDSQLRSVGNLRDNPSVYGKQIWLYGKFATYMGTWGITGNSGASSQFQIDGVSSDGGGVADGDGSESSPYNCAQIIALNPSSTTTAVASGVWVKGYIVGSMPTGGSSTTLSGTNFSTTDAATTNMVVGPTADCTDYTLCITVQLPTEANAPGVRSGLNLSDNPGNLGKEVSLYGDIMKYCGGAGIKNTSKYVLGEGGSTGGDSGDSGSTTTGSTIYSGLAETDTELTTGWSLDNVSLDENLSYVWSWKVYSSKGYLNASGYNTQAYAAEAYAVSPTIDLTGVTGATVSFDHAAKFQTNLTSDCKFCVRVDGTSSWTALTIPTWPTSGAWTFANSGDIDLSAYAGKKIQVAFKYVSTSSQADTWEIKNLVVKSK
jgi:hypothetical protein